MPANCNLIVGIEVNKPPIVYVLGVEGHFYIAEALKNEFDIPVIGIISCERVHEMMTPEREAVFDKLYSLPDYFFENIENIRALSRQELDKQQKQLEEKHGITNTAFLTNTDRRIRSIGDFRKVRNWQLCNLMFIDEILNEVTPAFVLDGVITYLQLALRKACEAQDIPYLLSMASRSNSYAFYHANGQQVGMEKLFSDFQTGRFDKTDRDRLKEADAYLDSFLEKPTRPAYAVKNSLTKFNWPTIKHKLALAFNKGKLFPGERVKNIDIYMNAELSFLNITLNFIRSRYRRLMLKTLKVFDNAPDLKVPHVYVPLHYSPEITDLFFGTDCDHHEAFVTHLSKYMPSDTQLYIKEHTSMIGRRPMTFYKNLKKLYNVKIIDPRVSTFELIKNASATITVTGTPGWEAFLMGYPSVAFGNVFYNHMPGVLHAPLREDFNTVFSDYLENFKKDADTIRNAFRAYYLTTYDCVKVDVGYTSDKQNAYDHAALFAQSLKSAINRWHHEMQGDFPKAVLDQSEKAKPDTQKKQAHA